MVCPVCPVASLAGGYVGGYFGIGFPEDPKLRILSALITAGLIVTTVVAMKVLFGVSVCDGNGDFSLRNIIQVSVITILMGIVYSVAVNFFINLIAGTAPVDPALDPVPNPESGQAPPPCCCEN